jgi:gamma-glutamyl phosphate reductase
MERYLDEIVDPIVKEFSEHPDSRRHAFIACVAVFHSIDYLAYPRKSRTLREEFRKASPAFQIVDEIAHAFKHVDTGGRTPLRTDKIVTHKGGFSADFSDGFDVSKVTVKDRPDLNLLSSVLAAVSFLRAYRPPNSSAPQASTKRPPPSKQLP